MDKDTQQLFDKILEERNHWRDKYMESDETLSKAMLLSSLWSLLFGGIVGSILTKLLLL